MLDCCGTVRGLFEGGVVLFLVSYSSEVVAVAVLVLRGVSEGL